MGGKMLMEKTKFPFRKEGLSHYGLNEILSHDDPGIASKEKGLVLLTYQVALQKSSSHWTFP